MAIDYVVNYTCVPKRTLGTDGILARLKGRDQAQRVIRVYREADDPRPVEQMGFEFTRTQANGEEETQVILISDLLKVAEELRPLEAHCNGCPVNVSNRPFGCFGRINYPLTDHAERWLLLQLPIPADAPLVWSLLGETLRELNEQSGVVNSIRPQGVYFESVLNPRRRLGEIALSGNNVFYLLFMLGTIEPSRAAITLLFFHAIPRNLEAHDILKLTPAPADAEERFPFLMGADATLDDQTIHELKQFFRALYVGWRTETAGLLDV